MWIIELVIDGFKSYAVRTTISGWDESFNSITGLNGSGKSNILDAVCFVLGITNMSTVRAQNLQDLIYKRGQAGVTRASVTIIFDNMDKSRSPPGFTSFGTISVTRQIVLGGTSKYLVNGHRVQQHMVQSLFQSVQLNINNPNFVIMQGRITKVLNMKPMELLAMIEEASGTRMFEDRKDKAFKTMDKKELKVKELETLLAEEIVPKLEKLRLEKRAFLDYQQTRTDVERLTYLVVAHDYVKSQDKVVQGEKDLQIEKARVKELEESTIRLKSEMRHLDEDLKRVREARDRELKKGGKFQALEDSVKNCSHELVRLTTVLDLKNTSMKEEKDERTKIEGTVTELEAMLKDKAESLETLQAHYDVEKTKLDEENEEVDKKEELLQTLQTGVASKEGQESGYQGQLQDARNRMNIAATEQEQNKLKITHLKSRIQEDEPRAKTAREENSKLLGGIEGLRSVVKELEAKLKSLGIDPAMEKQVHEEEKALEASTRSLREKAEAMKRKVANIDFSYTDPFPNFERLRVKGLVAQLFTLDENKFIAGTALEICAGGRLYNVVVDTADTATQLLEKGRLKKRVTIIPLNKISSFRASAEKIGAAQKIAPGKVDIALSLIGYDEEVSKAMVFVFGSTFICQDAESALKVTFDPAVRMKSVTLDGDVYDPSGTLAGGSALNTAGVLVVMQKLNGVQKELKSQEQKLSSLRSTITHNRQKLDEARQISESLDLKRHEIQLIEERINNNSSSSIIQAVETMKEEVVQLKENIAAAKKRAAEASADIKRIEKDLKEFNNNKDSKLAQLQSSLESLKRGLIKRSTDVKAMQKDLQDAKVESEQTSGDVAAAKEQLSEVNLAIKVQEEEALALNEELSSIKDAQDIAQARLDEERKKLTRFDDELEALEEAARSKSARIAEEGLELQKIGHLIEKIRKDQQTTTQGMANLEHQYEWVRDAKDSLRSGVKPFNYQNENIPETKSLLKNLIERFQGMKKKVNPKVMNMIDNVEKKENILKNNMRTVVRDKKKIEDTIRQLDNYKLKALTKTWEKVNKDFGQIFEELLPGGSFAKLVPSDGKSISQGLEVKVCLGKVWKESLTELSGGQRSLIAISLIMALLQFKPAPMYILDEVDAALDLSHTQNIGRLIKTRFKGAQFIVVSLKDGMFQNANRIFRTRFSEGTSCVEALTPADAI